MTLTPPFPYFGGKRKVATLVWERFGDVHNYVEPFFGGGAVMLARPDDHARRVETINDKSGYVSNFWRAVQHDPQEVAFWADWPVNECDLHARHRWLVNEGRAHVERLMTDPDYYDPQVAGWWVWGICQWIGGGWCRVREAGSRQRPSIGTPGMGVHAESTERRRPKVGKAMGIHAESYTHQSRPYLDRGGRGILGDDPVSLRRPKLGGRGVGAGIHAGQSVHLKRPRTDGYLGGALAQTKQKLPDLSHRVGRGAYAEQDTFRRQPNIYRGNGRGMLSAGRYEDLCAIFGAIQDRFRRVRVCCGDWSRVTGPTPTYLVGLTGVFLDPPYAHDERDPEIYAVDEDVSAAVRAWCLANGDNPKLRIALCGLDGEHDMPSTWEKVPWKASGGYAFQAKKKGESRGIRNAARETIWFSPHCLRPSKVQQASLALDHLAL